jgi:hypothetical protein
MAENVEVRIMDDDSDIAKEVRGLAAAMMKADDAQVFINALTTLLAWLIAGLPEEEGQEMYALVGDKLAAGIVYQREIGQTASIQFGERH